MVNFFDSIFAKPKGRRVEAPSQKIFVAFVSLVGPSTPNSLQRLFLFMARLKIHRSFGSVPNQLLNNPDITFKAKGLFAYLNSKPEDWDFSIESISKQNKEGLDAVRTAIHELEHHLYLIRKRRHNEKGHWEIEYILYETPQYNSHVVDACIGKSNMGEPTQQYKKELTKKENTKKEDNTGNLDFGDWSEAMHVWIDYRKKIKKPLKTERGINSCLNDLKKVCTNNPQLAMLAVEYCMNKEWQGIYAPKEPLKGPTDTGLHVDNEDYKLGKLRYRRQHEFALYSDYVKNCQQYGHTIKPQGYDYDNGI